MAPVEDLPPTPVAVACALFYSYIKSSKMAPVEDLKSSKMAPVEDLKVPAIQPKTPKTATVKPRQVETQKSVSNAIAIKEVGNRLLKQGKTEDAVSAYSRAISECPDIHELDDSVSNKIRAAELAKIYQNRAFAHERLGKIDAAFFRLRRSRP